MSRPRAPLDSRLTDRQAQVLWALHEHARKDPRHRGLTASQVRDRIYPPDSPMRTKRTAGRGASSFNGSVGALGNLAAGRILAGLERRGFAWSPGDGFRWEISPGGAGALGYYYVIDGSFHGMTWREFDAFYADLAATAERDGLCPNCHHTLTCDAEHDGCHSDAVDGDPLHTCPPNQTVTPPE